MRSFVLRARAAPTESKLILEGVGQDAHTETGSYSDEHDLVAQFTVRECQSAPC